MYALIRDADCLVLAGRAESADAPSDPAKHKGAAGRGEAAMGMIPATLAEGTPRTRGRNTGRVTRNFLEPVKVDETIRLPGVGRAFSWCPSAESELIMAG